MGSPRLAVALWIALWVTLSVSIILTNKYILGYTDFRFPFLLALWHMLLASLSARTMMNVLDVPDTIKQHGSRTLNMQLAAIGVLFGTALVMGNASFIFLSVPTVQMLKVKSSRSRVCLHCSSDLRQAVAAHCCNIFIAPQSSKKLHGLLCSRFRKCICCLWHSECALCAEAGI